MKTPLTNKSNGFKILSMLAIIAGAIIIFRFGHTFGQWLYVQLH